MRLVTLALGLFIALPSFARDLKISDCRNVNLTTKETGQTRAFSDNQIQFTLGQNQRAKGGPVDLLVMRYGNYCRMLSGTFETDLKEAVPIANAKLGQYTIVLDVGMSWNEGYVFRKVVAIFYKNASSEADAIDVMISKMP